MKANDTVRSPLKIIIGLLLLAVTAVQGFAAVYQYSIEK